MSQPFIGQIVMFGGNFAPLGYLMCNGQLVSIAQYETLYALVGTTYGGDGQSTFGLPDLRGRVPIHQGTGAGLSTYVMGEMNGVEDVTLTAGQIGTHSHTVLAASSSGSQNTPSNSVILANEQVSLGNSSPFVYAPYDAGHQVTMASSSVQTTGGGNQPHTNIQPVTAVTYIIATDGIYPTQS